MYPNGSDPNGSIEFDGVDFCSKLDHTKVIPQNKGLTLMEYCNYCALKSKTYYYISKFD